MNDRLKFRVYFSEYIEKWDNPNIKYKFNFHLDNIDCLNNGESAGILSLQNCNEQIERQFIELQNKNNQIVDSDLDIFIDKFQINNCIQYDDYLFIKKFLKIVQSTGLKDKNGKLIFWGDLLKDESGRIFTYKELWKDRELVCFWQNINFKNYFQEEGYKLGCYDILEVIGNVHENPELLEVKK